MADESYVPEGIARAVMTGRAGAIASIAVLGADARLTASCRLDGRSDSPDRYPYPTTATKSGTVSPAPRSAR